MADKIPFRMSSAGGCPKAVVAERLGHQPAPLPEFVSKAAEEGKWHEWRMKQQLKKEGYEVEECELCPICKELYGRERNGIHVEFDNGDWIATGHLDTRLKKNGLTQGGEIKSRSHFEYTRWMQEGFAGFPDEAAQLTIYMAADPQDSWLYITKNRSSGYEDRRTITEPPMPLEILKTKLSLAAKHIVLKTLPEIDFDSNNIQCRRCRFSHLCVPNIERVELVKMADLQSAAAKWRKGDVMVATGKALVKIAKEAFEEHSKACGFDRWAFEGLVINYIHVKGSTAYNKQRLLEIFSEGELAPALEFKLPFDYIKVSDKRKNEEEIGDAEMRE